MEEKEMWGSKGTSQWYFGTPNGVLLCVNSYHPERRQLDASFYHMYSEAPTRVENWDELLFKMEEFFDLIGFPYPTVNERSFDGDKDGILHSVKKEKVMRDDDLLKKHGDLGTFIIRVQHRQNSSWQGRITWMDENKTVYFRSVWEMIKLIEGALPQPSDEEGEVEEPTWD